ncbi:extracellular solute-binding protein family 3 [Segniliparus rotundus DSM 44985]|uniref:Extracellular solute-binding protein family 3 n=1 Tax=Segniliparus rotundus (strain ATCC BAA-972 / CDC 1076 / CIP 108378 / DSM 44985 / JCM 13578) TaxID=640132 RepID=D6ZA81_SEGRD|nr:glutamate ABC transporter substrate-binding protein [Segniliparus rotundus]ADG96623.1 extracellular solute-binding protein family 3 [Segniliparus rotundus DSM 44985]
MSAAALLRALAASLVSAVLAGCSAQGAAVIAQPSVSLPPLLPAGAALLDSAALSESEEGQCAPPLPLRPYSGNHDPIHGGRLDRILQRGKLVVGLDQGTYPFSYRDSATGQMKGFDVAMAREIAQGMLGDPNRVDYRIISSAGRTTALENDSVDIVIKTMSINCKRMKEITFSEPYFETDQRVMAATNANATTLADRKILGESTVCAARGSTAVGHFHHLFPTAKILGTTTWADCLVAIQQGSVDAISSDESILYGFYDQDPNLYFLSALQLGREVYGVGMHKGEAELERVVNKIIEEIKADGTWTNLCRDNLKFSPCNRPPATPEYAPEEPSTP